jgi:hypothetical protein
MNLITVLYANIQDLVWHENFVSKYVEMGPLQLLKLCPYVLEMGNDNQPPQLKPEGLIGPRFVCRAFYQPAMSQTLN